MADLKKPDSYNRGEVLAMLDVLEYAASGFDDVAKREPDGLVEVIEVAKMLRSVSVGIATNFLPSEGEPNQRDKA